jgi:hypothetical protein
LELLGKEIGMFADRTKVDVNANAFLEFLGACNEKVREHRRELEATKLI